ncbi:MAG: hypothetical protein K2X39_04030, partial [Silvanigrellaceae bacterium]|nr:hypothetical protein [Silvanigrellaceae bacterium]
QKFPLRLKVGIDYLEQLKDFTHETFAVRRILRNVKSPVLWIHGMKDNIFPYEKTAALMMEIESALFQYADEKREYLLMPFADEIINYSLEFIEAKEKVRSKSTHTLS